MNNLTGAQALELIEAQDGWEDAAARWVPEPDAGTASRLEP